MTRKHALVLLAASTLTAAVGLPALGTLADPAGHGETSVASRTACSLSLASDDDDCGGDRAAPAPAALGTLSRDGLFGTGAPPRATVN